MNGSSMKSKGARKRPRLESSPAIKCTTNRPAGDDATGTHNSEDDPKLLLSPHILRLLKLVEEGTAEHAQLAATQLADLSAGACSPLILWDILGRLQGYLIHSEWRTRQNASLAMDGVARQLPAEDQKGFLEQIALYYRDEDTLSSRHEWLTMEDLRKDMPTILEKGRVLLSISESIYDQQEEDALAMLDANVDRKSDFVQQRVQLQRQILARRLGLSSILNKVSGNEVENVLSLEDIAPLRNKDSTVKSAPPNKKPEADKEHMTKSIRSLLLSEIRQQHQQQHSDSRGVASHRLISHRNAQRLLATELVFRMFDSSWYIRHGSLAGIKALLKAWKMTESSRFGIWQEDIMARCLCILALDRFADYSETATAADTGGIVAPVKEMAGQVFSVLFQVAPVSTKRSAFGIISVLSQNHPAEVESWEIHHGALLALRYCFVLQQEVGRSSATIFEEQIEHAIDISISALCYPSDDVRGLGAQVLSVLLARGGRRVEDVPRLDQLVQYLWSALSESILISTSAKDLVTLLSVLAQADFPRFMQHLPMGKTKEHPCSRFLDKVEMLLSSPYASVQSTVVNLLRTAATEIENLFVKSSTLVLGGKQDGCGNIAESFCRILRTTFKFFSLLERHQINTSDEAAFEIDFVKTWECLVQASRRILASFPEKRQQLECDILLIYFGFIDVDCGLSDSHIMESSTGKRHSCRKKLAKAIAVVVANAGFAELGSKALLELCLRLCVRSPFMSHCESACLLYASLLRMRAVPDVVERCKIHIFTIIDSQPLCLNVDKKLSAASRLSLIKSLCAVLEQAVKTASGELGFSEDVIDLVSTMWQQATGSYVTSDSTVVNFDAVRLSVLAAGAVIAGGVDYLPTKLTSIIRPLMTSTRNELDADCQATNIYNLSSLLKLFFTDGTCDERKGAFDKAGSKIVLSLCKIIKSGVKPSCETASKVLSRLVDESGLDLRSFSVIWGELVPLADSEALCETKCSETLAILQAVCEGIRSNTASTLIENFMVHLVSIRCVFSQPLIQTRSSSCIRLLISSNQALSLKLTLPVIAKLCNSGTKLPQERALDLLLVVLDGSVLHLCPFVRALLPLCMRLMTSPSPSCAKSAARAFSKLVQLAPLVKESYELHLLPDESSSEKATQVMDHLIHGQPLPTCELQPLVAKCLESSGISLRPYQLEGITWLRFLQTLNLNGALTDAMGLGKTLQSLVAVALAHVDIGIEESQSLVVCPSSVLGHWRNEVERFFPGSKIFRTYCLHGPKVKSCVPKDCNLIITSYSILRTEISTLSKLNLIYCVLDEGHLLKNPKTATAKASRKLNSQFKLILTGTPVQNKVHEVWATFDFLMPNFLGSSSEFSKEFAKPISKGQLLGATAEEIASSMEQLKMLHQQVLPFILRREKEQVLQELPPKIISAIPCDMSPRQRHFYESFCSSNQGKNCLGAFRKALDESSGATLASSLGSDVLKALLYLRLICTHPTLVTDRTGNKSAPVKVEDSGKLVMLQQLLIEIGCPCQEISAADNDTSLLYIDGDEDDGTSMPDDISDALDVGMPHAGVVASAESTRSESKCLIFAQFTRSLDIVEGLICQQFPSTQYLRLDGKVQADKRNDIADKFNADRNIKILMLTTRIGGLGLNLTGADTVIFLEHDWNPHVDLQAMDRAHRIGQKKTLNVYKLITTDSIEEKVMKLHEQKLAMSKAIVNAENSTLYSMATDQLLDIFRFRSETSTAGQNDLGNALDSLVERYEEEYSSLSLVDFVGGFKGVKRDAN